MITSNGEKQVPVTFALVVNWNGPGENFVSIEAEFCGDSEHPDDHQGGLCSNRRRQAPQAWENKCLVAYIGSLQLHAQR